jgi:hypothetical protein
MNGVVVKMVGSKWVVEVDILRAIAEGVSGGRPISSVKPGPKPQDPGIVVGGLERPWSWLGTARAIIMCTPNFLLERVMATLGALKAFAATGENAINYIVRHMNLDPGLHHQDVNVLPMLPVYGVTYLAGCSLGLTRNTSADRPTPRDIRP